MFRPSVTCLDDSSVNPKLFLWLPTATRAARSKWFIDVRNLNYIYLWLDTTAVRRYSIRRLAAAILRSHTGNRPHQRGYSSYGIIAIMSAIFSSASCSGFSTIPLAKNGTSASMVSRSFDVVASTGSI